MLFDPEQTIVSSAVREALEKTLASISTVAPFHIFLVESSSAKHLHAVIDQISQRTVPTLEQIAARLEPVAFAHDKRSAMMSLFRTFRGSYESIHPLRPALITSNAALQLSSSSSQIAAAMTTATTSSSSAVNLMISLKERRIRLELPERAANRNIPQSLIVDLIKSLANRLRWNLQKEGQQQQTSTPSSSSSSSLAATSEADLIVSQLNQALTSMKYLDMLFVWTRRIALAAAGVAIGVVIFMVMRWLQKLQKRAQVLAQNRILNPPANLTCSICLEASHNHPDRQEQRQNQQQQQQQEQEQEGENVEHEGDDNNSSASSKSSDNNDDNNTNSVWIETCGRRHFFHEECLRKYILATTTSPATCPLCRNPLNSELLVALRPADFFKNLIASTRSEILRLWNSPELRVVAIHVLLHAVPVLFKLTIQNILNPWVSRIVSSSSSGAERLPQGVARIVEFAY